MKGRIWLVTLLLAIITLLVGCSRQSGTGSKPVEVGLVSPAMTSTFHVTLVEGAKDLADMQKWNIRCMAPERESNFAAQVGMIEDLIQSRVKAISICAIDDKAVVGAVQKANKAGIPIFVHNSLTPLPGGDVVAYIGYDQRDGGRKCGEKAAALLKEKYGKPEGNVVILEGLKGFHTNERAGGFKEALLKYPDIRIVAEQPADWERDKAVTVTENLLQRNKKIDLVFGCSDAMAQGAAQAAKHMGVKVFTIGIDGNPDAIADVGRGNLTATLAVFPFEMGQTVVASMNKHLAGKKLPKFIVTKTAIVDKSNWGKFK